MYEYVSVSAVSFVKFSQSVYTVFENGGSVYSTLILSTALSFDVTIQIKDISISATG